MLLPPEFPVSLRIRKFGYKEETIIVNSPEDSILISIIPLEIHKKYSGYKVTLEYASSLLIKAVEKLRINAAAARPDRSQREHVYCRITSSADSTMNSLFESYSQMNVNEYYLQGYQSDVARFASTINSIPWITGNMLEFKIEPFIRLPFFAERFINRKGFFEQDGNRTELTLLLT